MEAVDHDAARIVTLPKASKLLGKPSGYFTLRKPRWVDHDELPFPQPVSEVAGFDVYDLQALVVWDGKRKARDARKRAEWAQNRQAKEA